MLAANFADQVFPSIDRLSRAVGAQNRFRVSNAGIVTDGDRIGSIGLRCEEEPHLRKAALSFGIVVTRLDFSEPGRVHGRVMWGVPWIRGRQDGYAAYEAKTNYVGLEDGKLPRALVRELPKLEEAFLRALGRGHPPGVALSFWNAVFGGLPMPQVARDNCMSNHLLDPTSPSVTPPAGAGGAPSVAADH